MKHSSLSQVQLHLLSIVSNESVIPRISQDKVIPSVEELKLLLASDLKRTLWKPTDTQAKMSKMEILLNFEMPFLTADARTRLISWYAHLEPTSH